MGLIKAGMGALGGTFADQWKEFFYCEALGKDVLVTKGQKRITGRSSNTKGNDNIISNGSGIAVADGQCMLIVEQGKVVEVCAEPGEFTYDTSSEPSIFAGNLGESIRETFKVVGKRFTYGGDTGKDQRVYYINTKEMGEILYGTATPIPFRVVVNEELGYKLSVDLRCNGNFTYRISDPLLFYTNVCGNVESDYESTEIAPRLKGELMTALQPALATLSAKKIQYYEIPAYTLELSDALNDVLSKTWKEKRGIEDVLLRNLDRVFYDDFELFLRTNRNLSPKTVHEHLYRLKKMTMRAVSQGTIRRDPYCRLHPELPKRKSRHLKLEDLKTLLTTPVEKPQLQFVRDMFIFSTFTGLAYADLKRLTVNDIIQSEDGSWWIHIQRQKTGTLSSVRLLDIPLKIIEKYREQRHDDKVFNLYKREYFIMLTRKLGEVYGFELTFHMARHNFGTHITLSMGIPIETVGKMMGHMRIETTQLYAKVTDKKVDEDMKRLKAAGLSQTSGLYEEDIIVRKQRRKSQSQLSENKETTL